MIQFRILSNVRPWSKHVFFFLKTASDPPPLRILNLHGKRENRKNKNIRRELIDKARDVCSYLCKNLDIAPDLKFSRAPMFFFENQILPQFSFSFAYKI